MKNSFCEVFFMGIAYYNGDIGRMEEIRVPLSDRAVFFGDGIYDAAMGRRGKTSETPSPSAPLET